MRPRGREGEIVRQRGKEGERETVRLEREDEKNKNKKGIKNYKEIIFKWSCKKNRSFDVWYIVKWVVKIVKVVFWDCKC